MDTRHGTGPLSQANEWDQVVALVREMRARHVYVSVITCAPYRTVRAVFEPSPGADVAGVSPVPVQMWQG